MKQDYLVPKKNTQYYMKYYLSPLSMQQQEECSLR